MTKIVLLDAGPLSKVTHPRPNREITEWLKALLEAGVKVQVPEIADYEVRRELLRAKKAKGVERLDMLAATIGYIPLSTKTMRKASQIWADARNQGRPTADDKALDGDVILAAQADILASPGTDVVIATENVGHLNRFATASHWTNIQSSP